MAIDNLSFTRDWTNATDFPTIEENEETVRYDMQYLFNEIKNYLNTTLVAGVNKAGVDVNTLTWTNRDGETFGVASSAQANTLQSLLQYLAQTLNNITIDKFADIGEAVSSAQASATAAATAVSDCNTASSRATEAATSATTAAEAATAATASKADLPALSAFTLTAAGWSGSSAPYTQQAYVPYISQDESNPSVQIVGYASNPSNAVVKAAQKANIVDGGSEGYYITFKAYGEKPTVDIPLVCMTVKKALPLATYVSTSSSQSYSTPAMGTGG